MKKIMEWGWRNQQAIPTEKNNIFGRVCAEYKDRYGLITDAGELEGIIRGKERFRAGSRQDFPIVGDWVECAKLPGESKAIIEHILPRTTLLARQENSGLDIQPFGANVDTVFLLTSANGDFNPRRLERSLALVQASGAKAVFVLTKIDLVDDPWPYLRAFEKIAPQVPALAIECNSDSGFAPILPYLPSGDTIALLGMSGVGKSTLLNCLLGTETQLTRTIRESDSRGRHTTTARELFLLPQGAIILDTPGIRGFGLVESDEDSLVEVFSEISLLGQNCRFHNCSHLHEPGCAVQAALRDGTLEEARWLSWQKLQKEQAFLARKNNPALQSAQKQEWKKRSKAIRGKQ